MSRGTPSTRWRINVCLVSTHLAALSYGLFRASDDGTRIAFDCGDIVSADVCAYDLTQRRLTVYPDLNLGDVSADGARLVGHTRVAGPEVRHFDFGDAESGVTIDLGQAAVFSPDGRSIAYRSGDTTSIEAFGSPHVRAIEGGDPQLLDAETGLPGIRALYWVPGR